jgi:hypothetical protein
MSDVAGAIDVHVHAGPSFFDRKYDAVELAEVAAEAGMEGVVLKSHFGDTHKPARLAARRADVEVYSSVTLNSFVGGFNPVAVEHALETGARVVWLPTFSAANFPLEAIDRGFPFSRQSLRAVDDDGSVTDEARAVLETVGDTDRSVALGNGHLSREESFAVLEEMEEMGLSVPYLITHADFPFMGLSVEDQVELADRGAVIEKCYLPVVHGDLSVGTVVESVEAIGAERCVLSTDHGQANNESPPAAYAEFMKRLRDAGMGEDAIRALTRESPRRLLGLDT